MTSITDILTREEIRDLGRASDARGWLSVLTSWSIIFAAFALAAWDPSPVTILVALVLLGGRQLALAVLMHECSHRSLFANAAMNRWAGRWLCGAPVWSDVVRYRTHHMTHHAHAGTERDPDLSLVAPFPVKGWSLTRKLLRDLTGVSGVRRIIGLVAMDLGLVKYTASDFIERADQTGRSARDALRCAVANLGPVVLSNGALFGVLWLAGHGWLYLLWIGAYLTTFSLFLRIRSMAEHACTTPSTDPVEHTRTTYAGWLARLTVAPHDVNYHTEHHLLMTVPHYNLRRMHDLLKERGALANGHVTPGYSHVLRLVVAR